MQALSRKTNGRTTKGKINMDFNDVLREVMRQHSIAIPPREDMTVQELIENMKHNIAVKEGQ